MTDAYHESWPDSQGRGVDYRQWFWRVVAWDGVLPIVVISISITIQSLFQNHAQIVELIAVSVPITFFWIRVRMGISQILHNGCAQITRALQFGLFGAAILFLVLFECILILMPPGQLFATRDRRIIFGVFSVVYVTIMIFAWYPGRKPTDR